MSQPFDRLRATSTNHPTLRQAQGGATKLPDSLSVVLLLALFALLILSIQNKSPTLDEQNHIARGLAYLKTGDLRLSQEHPPLINAWQAWPLLLDPTIRLPLDSPSWANAEWYGFADQLLWQVNDGATRDRMVFAARVCTMGLTLLLAALVYRWGKALGGAWTGLLAMTVLAFDPNILAHGRLATTDMGITCLSFAAMFALWVALQDTERACRVTHRHWAAAGAVLGLALTSKFSALVLGPVGLLIIGLTYLGRSLQSKKMLNVWPWVVWTVLWLTAVLVVIWAVYGFEWGPIAWLGGLPGPVPLYMAGVQTILQRTGGGSTAFLLGQLSERGWWYYFPVAFAIKTPLPTLILLALALFLAVKERIAVRHSHSCLIPYSLLLIPVLAFWSMALTGGFNIGYRHILPSLPFLYLFIGAQVNHCPIVLRRPPLAIRRLLFAICYLLLALFIFPNYLSFFNLLVGGPAQGYRYLVDSNLDWGQDLPGLARWVKQNNIERINLSWFGAAHPEAYDFDFHPLPGFWRFGGDPATYGFNPLSPALGWYAISASNLQGIKLADSDTLAWFRRHKPDAGIGHSILIYHVARPIPSRVVALAVPTARLADAERALLAEGAQVRQFDPASGVIVPTTNEAWYILAESPGWGEPVRQGPGYVVIRGTPPLPTADLSAKFGNWVNLRYHQVRLESSTRQLIVQAGWEVIAAPHRTAVSFAHLLSADGYYLAGWDGLTAPATCWQPGDVIIQNYAIPLPADLPPGRYQIEVGWYDAETVQRWPCLLDGRLVGDRFIIETSETLE